LERATQLVQVLGRKNLFERSVQNAPMIESSLRRHVLKGELPVRTAEMAGAKDRLGHARQYGNRNGRKGEPGCPAHLPL